MKMGKTPMLLKKATSMCKSKTSLIAARLLVLATLQRHKMAAVAMISNKIHTLIVADRERVNCHKAVAIKVESRQAIIRGDMAVANHAPSW
jgi:RNase P subunit RPR2